MKSETCLLKQGHLMPLISEAVKWKGRVSLIAGHMQHTLCTTPCLHHDSWTMLLWVGAWSQVYCWKSMVHGERVTGRWCNGAWFKWHGMVMVNGPQGMVCFAACKVLDPCSIWGRDGLTEWLTNLVHYITHYLWFFTKKRKEFSIVTTPCTL